MSISIQGNARQHAQSLALQGGKELSDLIAALLIKKDEVAAAAVSTLNFLRLKHGDVELLNDFPRLETEEDKENPSNTFVEYYDAQVVVDGETKTKAANFFTDYYLTLPIGEAQNFVIKQCTMALGKQRDAAEEAYKQMPLDAVKNLLKRTKNSFGQGRSYVRKAIGVAWVQHDLHEQTAPRDMGNCKVGEAMVSLEPAEGSDTNSFPYNLIDNTRLRFYRPMSVSDVNKLDVAAAVAEGGHLYDQLERQLKRGTKGGTGSKLYPVPANADAAYDCIMALVHYLDNESDTGPAHQTELRAKMAQKKGGELMIRAVAKLKGDVNALWNPALDARYARMIDKELAQGGDAAQAA